MSSVLRKKSIQLSISDAVKKSSAKIFPEGSLLIALYGATIGKLAFLGVEATTNQACCGMICKNPMQAAYLYYHLLHNQKFIATQAIGGAQENLSIPRPGKEGLVYLF